VVRELKKDHAIEDLLRTNRSIGDIASALGFYNPTSFTRAFKTIATFDSSPRNGRVD
jgi:AraC-like DNA-binding protein